MKTSEETCLIPGPEGPQGWRASGKDGMNPVEPGRMKRADWVALPQKSVLTLPARFPAMSDERLESAAQLELEGLGMSGLTTDEFQVTTLDADQKDQRAMIVVPAGSGAVPPEASLDSHFAPSVDFKMLTPGELSLWQEQGQLCMAIPDENGNPLHAQALTARQTDEDAAAEIRCVLGAMDLLGMTPDVKEVLLERSNDEPPPAGLQEFSAEVGMAVVPQMVTRPRLPRRQWRLTPAAILQKRRERAQRQTAFLAGLGAVLVLLALLGTFATRLWTRERAMAAEKVRLDAMEPELAVIRQAQERWQVIEPAISPDHTPAETFHQIARLMPEKGIRIAAFKMDGKNVILSGEASDQTLEGQLRQNLLDSKSPAFEGLQWDTPNSRQQPDGRLTFDWQASPPVTEEGTPSQ